MDWIASVIWNHRPFSISFSINERASEHAVVYLWRNVAPPVTYVVGASYGESESFFADFVVVVEHIKPFLFRSIIIMEADWKVWQICAHSQLHGEIKAVSLLISYSMRCMYSSAACDVGGATEAIPVKIPTSQMNNCRKKLTGFISDDRCVCLSMRRVIKLTSSCSNGKCSV